MDPTEYKEIIYAYYYALGRPSQERHTANSYSIWRTRNQESRPYLDENKLANVRRDILRNNRLTDSEISAKKYATENEIHIRHKGNEELDEQYSPPRGLIERLPSDQSTQRPEGTRTSIVLVKDSQENDKTTVTEDLAFAEEHRVSMAEMRQKILNTLEVHATENDINIRHKRNEESDEQYSPTRGLIERLPSDQSRQRPEDTRHSIVPVKDSQENEKTTVTEDLEFAEEHRESMAEIGRKS
ncbi:Hypothetical predicted protein [Octopus vulgaris]|uniref:Uncharacterized protein n=1 Tax=Octopus vulgaris TaxID=6645 RepID=A0AA36FFL6_OCTVU|nr:Hypothetical predicted protein [Octopus vulgaris]